MSQCNIGNLEGGSKASLAALLIVAIAGAGIAGSTIVYIFSPEIQPCPEPDPCPPCPPQTTVNVTIAENFTATVDDGGLIIMEVQNASACSGLISFSQYFSAASFEAVVEYLNESGEYFNETTIVDDAGLESAKTGVQFDFVSDQFMSPESTAGLNLNGQSFLIEFGDNYVLFSIGVVIWIDTEMYLATFSLNETNAFLDDIDGDVADYDSFTNGAFLYGANDLLIDSVFLLLDSGYPDEGSELYATLNGVDVVMELSFLSFF